MKFLDEIMKGYLDYAAKQIEDDLKARGIPWKFEFTHEQFEMYRQSVKLNEVPIVSYVRVKDPLNDPNELPSGSYLLVMASVLAFGRKQTAIVRCIFERDDMRLNLRIVGPVEVLETDYFPEEEKESGQVQLPDWVRTFLHQIIGMLILDAVRLILKKIFGLDP
jgi:hypothetical protein